MHPLALAESGWVWVGAGSRPAGLRTGRAIPGLRCDAALPVRQNTRQGREGGALPKPFNISLNARRLVTRRVETFTSKGLGAARLEAGRHLKVACARAYVFDGLAQFLR